MVVGASTTSTKIERLDQSTYCNYFYGHMVILSGNIYWLIFILTKVTNIYWLITILSGGIYPFGVKKGTKGTFQWHFCISMSL